MLHAAEESKAKDARSETAEVKRGKVLYTRYCAGCHGVSGDGKGEAAQFLNPPPRDLVAAEFKFSSRPTPGLPTDDDLRHLLRRGLKGTAMSGFPLLPDSDIEALIAQIKTFSARWKEEQAEPIQILDDPFASDPAKGVTEGDLAYHVGAMCFTCHPAYHTSAQIADMTRAAGFEPGDLRANAHLSVGQPNEEGTIIWPPDFKRDWIKSGSDVRNLYRVISAGITTTAMPTWIETLKPEQLWGLAHYVHSLAEQRPYRFTERYIPRPPFEQPTPTPVPRHLRDSVSPINFGNPSVTPPPASDEPPVHP